MVLSDQSNADAWGRDTTEVICLAFADRDQRAGFAHLASQRGSHGDTRPRELTLVSRDALGA